MFIKNWIVSPIFKALSKLGSVHQFPRLYQKLHHFTNFQGGPLQNDLFKKKMTSPNWFQKYGDPHLLEPPRIGFPRILTLPPFEV